MGNIIGESFRGYVSNQIGIRQNKLGQTQKSNEELAYIGSNAPFIKVTSGVNLEGELGANKLNQLGLDQEYLGNRLAQEMILFGGIYSATSGPKLGVATDYNINPSSRGSYGFISDSDYGLVPMPGITQATVKSLNRGSLRECEIKIKCYNRFQFNILELLFLRLKYSFLLEFGHSMYYGNEGNLINTPLSNSDYFLNGGKTQKQVLAKLEESREESSGNYDAFLGYVKNFTWDLLPNGSYDITIKGITPGDVIESLSINTLKTDSESEDDEEGDTALEKNKDKTTLNQIFNSLREKSAEDDTFIFGEQGVVVIDKFTPNLLPNKLRQSLKGERLNKWNLYSNQTDRECIRLEFSFNDSETGEEQLYLKLGSLLKVIENFCLLYDTSLPETPPIIDIDYGFESNVCFTLPDQFSTDPRVCLVPLSVDAQTIDDQKSGFANAFNYLTNNSTIENIRIFTDALGQRFKTDQPYVGRMMDIHVNLNFVSQALDQNIDKNGNTNLYDFLTKILEGIQQSLGGINKFEVIYNEDSNSIRFMDNTHIPGVFKYLGEKSLTESSIPPIPTRINTTLLKDQEGTFVTDVSIKSELTKDIANMITVGAQANGNVVGENATAFSRWNEGCIDRLVKEKQNSDRIIKVEETNELSPQEQFEKYQSNVLKYLNRVVRRTLDEDDIETYKSSFRPYLNYQVGELSKPQGGNTKSTIAPLGFIPLSLNIKMQGISGIKIYQKYTITEDLLPPNYRDRIEFLTKGVSHTINGSGWYTTIDGLTIPKPISEADSGNLTFSIPTFGDFAERAQEFTETIEDYITEAFDETIEFAENLIDSVADFFGFGDTDTPNADLLREELKKLGYQEKFVGKVGELTSGGEDITLEVAKYAIATFRIIKEQLPEITLVVTSGYDKYHSQLNYNSRHKKGTAVDFVLIPRPKLTNNQFDPVGRQRINTIETILKGFAAKGNGYAGYLNEYNNPTRAATAPHFHISWQRGTEGKENITKAVAEYNRGTLQGYVIT